MKTAGHSLIAALLLLANGCVGVIDKGPLVYGTSSRLSVNTSALKELEASLAPRCKTCHTWISDDAEVLKRVVLGDPEASPLFKVLVDGSMPKGGPTYTTAELESVRSYILALTSTTTPTVVANPPGSFAELREKVLLPKCVVCHASTNDEKTLSPRWVVAGNPEASRLYLTAASGSMPKWYAPITASERELARDYIHDFGSTEAKVQFPQLQSELLKMKCAKCHGLKDESELKNWVVPGRPEESSLLRVLEDGSMPKNLPKVTAEELQLLYNYIKNLKQPTTL